ncbi:tail fiber domain-containing protein [Spirosoma sp. BT702]|uniref:Tail fiber domain-containing protein n=1 Tax=Spirosoma profusum TaxID=2771354 RepID=A0A927ASU5_9BACT|nr:tail fiber domain-containing protein [Spirosoma profusum]MBD2704456.1 tail fiber domain-containing protein [Spirosoma profusum]
MKYVLAFILFLALLPVVHAQIGINSPVGVKPTQDLEVYTRNGFLVQAKYQYVSDNPNASINTLSCINNAPSLTALAGILKEPTGDGSYTAGVSYSCTQSISLQSVVSGSFVVGIELVFEDLDTESITDYVSIKGNNLLPDQKFSGNTPPERIIISGRTAEVKFVTNANTTVGRGFRIRWRALLFDNNTAATPIAFGMAMQFDVGTGSFTTGFNNKATAFASTAMGSLNTVDAEGSTVFGVANSATGAISIAGGMYNTASGNYSRILGSYNTASGDYSTAIGSYNVASGDYSTAIGNKVSTNLNTGVFVVGDSDPLSQGVTPVGFPDQFVARFLNGYILLTSGNSNPGGGTYGTVRTGVQIGRGQNSWATISDSTKKERFLPIDNVALLRKIGAMKLSTWNYKGQRSIRHYGPMAQDFYAAFGQDGMGQIGCDTLIYSHDFAGVTFAGVQALIQENATLKATLSQTNARLNQALSRLDTLETVWISQRQRSATSSKTKPIAYKSN